MARPSTIVPEMPAKLAASAFNLFSRHGCKKVNLDQIAADAGVTKGSLYWHYKSKDDLIKAACTHYYRAYHRRINTALAHITDPVKRLEETLRVSVRICLLDHENRVFSTEIFTLALSDAEVRRGWQQFYDGVREFYIGLVQAARATGKIQTTDPEQAVDFMLATMEGIKLQALYDSHLCSPDSEKAIVANLKRSLGFSVEKR
jgi:AcrR family transcriptional regulator